MAAFAGEGKLIPEQVWDTHDIPEHRLFLGRPTGSAMPLVWAHAEYVKLCRSLRDGRVFDMPPQTSSRYSGKTPSTPYATWRFDRRISAMPAGKLLRIELLNPAVVHYSTDAWNNSHDMPSRDTGLGVQVVDLPVNRVSAGAEVRFTVYWRDAGRWEGQDFAVRINK
jgi:glucoamylase